MRKYSIVIADDHALIRKGIKSILSQDPSLDVAGEAGDGEELLELLKGLCPDMVIIDINMPKVNGLEAVEQLHRLYPNIKILILTMYKNSQYFFRAVTAGAHGYMMKEDSDEQLSTAIKMVLQGHTYVSPQLARDVTDEMISAFRDKRKEPIVQLSDRERQVLELVVKGHTSKQMAEILCLSPRTVDHHRASLLKKFKMKNTVDLVNHVLRNSMVVSE